MFAFSDTSFHLFSLEKKEIVSTINVPDYSINSIKFDANGTAAMLTGESNIFYQLNLENNNLKTGKLSESIVTSFAYGHKGIFSCCGYDNGEVVLFTSRDFVKRFSHLKHQAKITALLFTADDSIVISGDAYGEIKIASYDNPVSLPNWDSNFGEIKDFVMNSVEHMGILTTNDIIVYDLKTYEILLVHHLENVLFLRFSQINPKLMVASTKFEILFIDYEKDKIIAKKKFSQPISGFDLCDDLFTVIVCLNQKEIVAIDLRHLTDQISLVQCQDSQINVVRFIVHENFDDDIDDTFEEESVKEEEEEDKIEKGITIETPEKSIEFKTNTNNSDYSIEKLFDNLKNEIFNHVDSQYNTIMTRFDKLESRIKNIESKLE